LNIATATRALTRHDLTTISFILDQTGLFPSEMLTEMAEPYLSGTKSDIWLVIHEGSTVLGFAYCEPERMTNGTYNLLAIAVEPEKQSRGVGQQLLAAVEQAVSALEGRILLVETSSLPEYERTRSFYDQMRFDREAVIREFYGAGEDKVIFWKRL
jgi:GNAT superfamily N-acetyltransferase